MRKVWDLDSFVMKSREIHGDIFDYKDSEYQSTRHKVRIRCKIHDRVFEQRADHHMNGRNGCPLCSGRGNGKRTTEDFVKLANGIHGGVYDYSETKYFGSNKMIDVICKKHGKFNQLAVMHLSGQGCPKCANLDRRTWGAHSKNGRMRVYCVRLESEDECFIKLGISRNGGLERLRHLKSKYQMSLIWEKELPTPDAVNMERTLLENCKSMRYEPKHKFKGWTECFDEVLVGELGI